jgi:hypothetical protein
LGHPIELQGESKVDPDGHYAGMILQCALNGLINSLEVIVNERALLPNERHPVVVVAIENPEVWI